jgi:predicted Rdx family selenoprotein
MPDHKCLIDINIEKEKNWERSREGGVGEGKIFFVVLNNK